VLAFDTMRGQRAVATPAAIDAALAVLTSSDRTNRPGSETHTSLIRDSSSQAVPIALRIAPDEVLVLGAGPLGVPDLTIAGDEHAIVVDEAGYSGRWLTWDAYERRVADQVEWRLPTERPALGQGRVAGVPAKLWCTDDGVLVLVATAYAHDLSERLA
jgi:hypothetical protein